MALPDAAPGGHLPGAGHRGVRRAPRPVDLRPAPTSTSGRCTISIFGTGSVPVDQLDVPGRRRRRRTCSCSSSVVFAVLYLAVVARPAQHVRPAPARPEGQPGGVRHPRHQPRSSRLAVFALSAAIAGVRRCPLRRHARRGQPAELRLRAEPAAAAARRGRRHRQRRRGAGRRRPDRRPAAPGRRRRRGSRTSTGCCRARMGITLGRNPNGIAVTVREAFAPAAAPAGRCWWAPRSGSSAVVALRLGDVIDGGVFALALVGGARGRRARPPQFRGRRQPAARGGRPSSRRRTRARRSPLEWAGIERPFTEDEVATLDRVLGLEAPRVGARR